MNTGSIKVSLEARVYAVAELCRRAGLTLGESPGRWSMQTSPDGTVSLQNPSAPGSPRILFPAFEIELAPEHTVRKSWSAPAPAAAIVPDFVVPFARSGSVAGEPLFIQTAPGSFRCTEDLPASTVLVLSRFEELDGARRDEHGRFPSSSSMAARDGYLDRPIVDEYGLALEQVIAGLDPGFCPAERRLRVKLSHDVDLVGIPWSLREAAVQLLVRRNARTGFRNLFSFLGIEPGSLTQVIEICRQVSDRGLRSALYWKASSRTALESGYDIADPRIAQVMDWARSQSIEMGVHPGYDTFLSPAELGAEVDRCRKAIGSHYLGGRQHYLRWSPATWSHWEQCGLAYDSSVGYADQPGFRAGTCVPYRPWLWEENRRAWLLEIPLIVMDRTLVRYMGQTPDQSLSLMRLLMKRCAVVGGVLTLLWHNDCLGRPFSAYYPRLFDALSGAENYDWEADARSLQATLAD